jgi:hypothetical protein
MGHIDRESVGVADRAHGGNDDRVVAGEFPRAGTQATVQVGVLHGRQDVELLATVCPVAVTDDAELLENVERPIDGRWDRVRIEGPAAIDQLRAGHVAVGVGKYLDEDPPLRGPAQTTGA